MEINNCEVCPLCDNEHCTILSHKDRKGNSLKTVCCDTCGLVRNSPIPSEEELNDFYAFTYRKSYKNTDKPKLRHHIRYFQRILQQIQENPMPYRKANEVLDIGSGSGEFAALMLGLGKNIDCIESTVSYAQYTKEVFGINVFTGSVNDFIPPEKKYDLIRLNHVVEHFKDPINKLKNISLWLKHGGCIFIEVPDFLSYCATKRPNHMFHYGHIFNFDDYTLPAMMLKSGLMATYTVSPTSVYFSLNQKCNKEQNIFANKNNAERNKAAYATHITGEHYQPLFYIDKISQKIARIFKEKSISVQYSNPERIASFYIEKLRKIVKTSYS